MQDPKGHTAQSFCCLIAVDPHIQINLGKRFYTEHFKYIYQVAQLYAVTHRKRELFQ